MRIAVTALLVVMPILVCSCASHERADSDGGVAAPSVVRLFPVRRDGRYGYITRDGKLAIPPKYDSGGAFAGGRARVELDGKWGFIDETGHEVIPPTYRCSPGDFSEGLARIVTRKGYGYVDATGRVVIPPRRLGLAGDFRDGLALVMKKGIRELGFLDRTGRYAIAPRFELALPFSEELAAVRVDMRWGYIDKSGKFVVRPAYTTAGAFRGGLAPVSRDGLKGFIDRKGNVAIKNVHPCWFRRCQPVRCVGSFADGLACVKENFGQYGYINRRGRLAIRPRLGRARDFSEGFAAVRIDGKWGFIDTRGRTAVRPRFDAVGNFRGGLARVHVRDADGKSSRMGYVDGTGALVWPLTK